MFHMFASGRAPKDLGFSYRIFAEVPPPFLFSDAVPSVDSHRCPSLSCKNSGSCTPPGGQFFFFPHSVETETRVSSKNFTGLWVLFFLELGLGVPDAPLRFKSQLI